MRTVYVVGAPGSGKSTALLCAICHTDWWVQDLNDKPFAHAVFDSGAVFLGKMTAQFPGTDTLALNVGPKVCQWIAQTEAPLVVGEGDRLAYAGFLHAARQRGPVDLLFIDVAPSIARQRALDRGTVQDYRWARGRQTKVDRLVSRFPHTRLDGSLPPRQVANTILPFLAL